MEISDFQWDEDNMAHIARHPVYPDEVEELAFDDEPWIRKENGAYRTTLTFDISLPEVWKTKSVSSFHRISRGRRIYKLLDPDRSIS